jgi:hypothetical protein
MSALLGQFVKEADVLDNVDRHRRTADMPDEERGGAWLETR